MNRLTLTMGMRFDWFNSSNPAFHLSPSLLTPNRDYDVPAFDTTRYKDWTPKIGAAYDLFGDGKTALKVNVGRYVLGQALVLGGLASQPGYNVQLMARSPRGVPARRRSDRIRARTGNAVMLMAMPMKSAKGRKGTPEGASSR